MSTTDFPIPEKKPETKHTHTLPMLSLNDAIRESMPALHEHPGLVMRCEHLPQVRGHQDELVRFFYLLIRLIINNKPPVPKLFLYVDCDEGRKDLMLESGFKKYIIRIHTNITTSDAWKEMNDHILSGCKKIIADHQGELQINNIKNTGCLFAISLAGKFA